MQRSSSPIRALVVDDELLGRQRITDLLAKSADFTVAGEAANGVEALAKIRAESPDLVFLDVEMPEMTGVAVAETLGSDMPPTIFITAYADFAVKAFEIAAVDYLLKPFDDDRFAQALVRARHVIDERASREGNGYLQRISIEGRGQLRFVPVDRIDFISAEGPYAELHVAGRTFAVRERMQTLEEQLDPGEFFRIHRSAIVRMDRIDSILRRPGGDYGVRLADGTELSLSRARREELERVLAGRG